MFGASSLLLITIILSTLLQVQCCTKATFEHTKFTALKHLAISAEVTDYNYFSKVKGGSVASMSQITGCLAPIDELEDVVAIQIRQQNVPIFYEGAVQNLPLLHSLHVEDSKVNILKPKCFQNLPALSVMKFIDNNLQTIPGNVFNNLPLRRLVLMFNNISYIAPEAFDDMPRLDSVNLSNNKLTSWNSDWFKNCLNVRVLLVKFNEITSLPARAFKNVEEKLERLYLSVNNIQHVSPRTFTGLKRLTDLSLYKNNISALDDSAFLYLPKLTMIDLGETSIGCFTDSFLNSLRPDVLLWINDVPLNLTCKVILEEWARDNQNKLTFFKVLRNNTWVKNKI